MWISIVAHIYTQMGYKQTHRREGGKKKQVEYAMNVDIASKRTHT